MPTFFGRGQTNKQKTSSNDVGQVISHISHCHHNATNIKDMVL
jgi:hypothetical protein